MPPDELNIGQKVLLFLFLATLLADFVIGLGIQSSVSLPSLSNLNSTTNNIHIKITYLNTTFSRPVGYPFNASATFTQATGVLGTVPNWIFGIGQGAVDIIYDLSNIIINLIIIFFFGVWIVIILVFQIIPQMINDLNIGIIGSFIVILNLFVFCWLGILAYTVIKNLLTRR